MKHCSDSKWRLSIFFCMCALTISSCLSLESIFANTVNQSPHMYPTNSKPFGKPYGHWLAEYYKWDVGSPLDENPSYNYDRVGCSPGQSGQVLFLSDILRGKEERNCIIPSGMAIILPTLSGVAWTDTRDNPYPLSDQTINEYASLGNNIGTINATLDGRTLILGNVQNLQNFRTQSPFFDITVPENDIYTPLSIPGVWRAQVDGYFVFLEPLSPGNYTLSSKVEVPESQPNHYSAELTYKLNVQPNYTLPYDTAIH